MEAAGSLLRQQNFWLSLWPCGPMDKASDYESGDSRFESWQGRTFSKLQEESFTNINNRLSLVHD